MESTKQKQKFLEENKSSIKILRVKPQKKESETSVPIIISRKMRWAVFSILNIIMVLMGLDQGILSSTTSNLSKDFQLTERELGGLGGMIFLGTALGCFFSFTLINKFNRKYLLITTMCFDVLSLFFTTQTTKIILLYLYRVIAGFTQSFLAIYLPVWSDQFGIHKYKSIMLSVIHLSSSFGYLVGYVLGILMGWENSFYLQNILIIVHILIIFMFLPDLYFSMSLMPLKDKQEMINKEEEKKGDRDENKEIKENEEIINDIKNIDIDINIFDEDYNEKLINEKEKEKKEVSNEEKKEEKEEDNESLFEDIKTKDNDMIEESILIHLKILIKSPIFILMNITLASMFIIVSAIQFWINDYLENGLFIADEKVRLYAFTFVVVTSPVAGIILGGVISGKIGGYDTEKSIYIPLIASFFVCILANITPLTSNLFIFLPLFWTYFFLGSVLLPVASGIVLVSVDKKYAGSASSISTLIYNIFGRLPGPNLYAFFKSQITDKNSRIPFWLLLNMAVPGFLAVLICVKFQKDKYRKNNIPINEEEKEDIFDKKINEEKIKNEKKKEIEKNEIITIEKKEDSIIIEEEQNQKEIISEREEKEDKSEEIKILENK